VLNARHQRGFTLVEAMVVLVIMAALLAAAVPNFGPWIAGMRIRSTAESVLAGLQYARSEATTRNTQVRFQLTSTLDGSCLRSTTGVNWVVDVVDADADADSVEGQCDAAPSDTAPSILQVRSSTETGSGTAVSASAATVVFNGLGRQVAPPSNVLLPSVLSNITIDITPTESSQCVLNGGKVTCLRVAISTAGQVRMCNPALASGDPQAC
jgi:type IV fimbrial biogenesis protein FimT